MMRHQVDRLPVWIRDKEPPNAPRLVGQGMDDLKSSLDRLRVKQIDIFDLEADVRSYRGCLIEAEHAQLRSWVCQGDKGDDSAHVHCG